MPTAHLLIANPSCPPIVPLALRTASSLLHSRMLLRCCKCRWGEPSAVAGPLATKECGRTQGSRTRDRRGMRAMPSGAQEGRRTHVRVRKSSRVWPASASQGAGRGVRGADLGADAQAALTNNKPGTKESVIEGEEQLLGYNYE